jgi:hypothetical protein
MPETDQAGSTDIVSDLCSEIVLFESRVEHRLSSQRLDQGKI